MTKAQDFASEWQHTLALPCLPTFLKSIDPSFKTAFFQPSQTNCENFPILTPPSSVLNKGPIKGDHQDAMIDVEGFDFKYSKAQMDLHGGFIATNYCERTRLVLGSVGH
jgi:hypothetical protein